jgi:hypothetical protein
MFPWFRVSADPSYHPERCSHDTTLYISYSMLSCNQKHMFFSMKSTTNLDIKYPLSPEEKYRSQHNHRTTNMNVAIITKTMARCKTNCHPRMVERKERISLSLSAFSEPSPLSPALTWPYRFSHCFLFPPFSTLRHLTGWSKRLWAVRENIARENRTGMYARMLRFCFPWGSSGWKASRQADGVRL